MEQMMLSSRWARNRYSRLVVIITATLFVFGNVPSAFAIPTCTMHTYYDVRQVSLNGNYIAITSGITDPIASTLPGDDTNKDNHDHILLWDGIVEETVPSGQQCGDGNYSKCWLQAGVGMGWVSTNLGGDFNGTMFYEPYVEWYGTYSGYYMHFFDGISINENGSPNVSVSWEGVGTSYVAKVKDDGGTWHILARGNLYYPAAHAAAHSEVVDWDSALASTCPTLTNGSPYQNNGTTYNGTISSSEEIYLTNDNYVKGPWSGSPDAFDANPYWLRENSDWPASFRANGPSASQP